jgi:hypothetical protein
LAGGWFQEATELSFVVLVGADEEAEDVLEEPLSLVSLVLVSLVGDLASSVLLGLAPFLL